MSRAEVRQVVCIDSRVPNLADLIAGAPAARREIAFIDAAVDHLDLLLAGLRGAVEAVVLDSARPALTQIAEVLQQRGSADAVHIVAHGSAGEVNFSAGALARASLRCHGPELARIGAAIDSGDIVLWSCRTGAGARGRAFVTALAHATGAEVQAATGYIGAAARGGCWELDVRTAPSSAQPPLTDKACSAYPGLMNAPPVIANAGNTISYTERQASPPALDPGLTVTDADNVNLAGATVTISRGFLFGDTLNFINQFGISGNYDAATGVLTLSGSDTLAHYQAALRSVTFSSISHNPTDFGTDTARTIDWQVSDGTAVSGSLFSAATNFAARPSPLSVAIGDVNGDDRPDLAVANFVSNNTSVLLGNGDGTFQPEANFAAGTNPASVAIGDVNGDGKADLAVANQGGNVSVLLGNGDGTFQAARNFVVGGFARSVAIGDINGDGKADLAVANFASNNVSVLRSNGDGTFQDATNFVAGTNPVSVAIGDLNGDGKVDLAVANTNSNNVSVLLGYGDDTFQAAMNFAAGTEPYFVAIGDVNGDGKADLAVANFGNNTVSVLLSNGDGTFQPAANLAVGTQPISVAIGDLNGDGKADLAVANLGNNNVSVLLGNGDGTFQAATNFSAGMKSGSVAIGDLNGDGERDLAVANTDSNNVSVLLNNSTNLSATQHTTVNITAVNDPPVAHNDSFNTAETTAIAEATTAPTDVDGGRTWSRSTAARRISAPRSRCPRARC